MGQAPASHSSGARRTTGAPAPRGLSGVPVASGQRSSRWSVLTQPPFAGIDLDGLQALLQTALEWRNLVRLMWVELGRPQVPGFPASRVQQILWGELSPDPGFFPALLNTLTARSRDDETRAQLRALWSDRVDSFFVAGSKTAGTGVSNLTAPSDGGAPDSVTLVLEGEDESFEIDVIPALKDGAAPQGELVTAVERLYKRVTGLGLPDPDRITGEEEFMAALRLMKKYSGRSFRQLEERSKESASGWLPRATAADMLKRAALPRADVLWAFTAACGVPREDQDRWEAARVRLRKQRSHGRVSGSLCGVEAA